MNRKLVRPSLSGLKDSKSDSAPPEARELAGTRSNPSHGGSRPGSNPQSGGGRPHSGSNFRRRPTPPDQTAAEAFYYLKQMNTQTPMVVVLDDGEQLRGHIEWYDRNCLKVHREDGPNLLVYKHSIRYLYKQDEE